MHVFFACPVARRISDGDVDSGSGGGNDGGSIGKVGGDGGGSNSGNTVRGADPDGSAPERVAHAAIVDVPAAALERAAGAGATQQRAMAPAGDDTGDNGGGTGGAHDVVHRPALMGTDATAGKSHTCSEHACLHCTLQMRLVLAAHGPQSTVFVASKLHDSLCTVMFWCMRSNCNCNSLLLHICAVSVSLGSAP